MEKQVIFRDRQEVQAVDFNNMQTFARDSLNHVVKDAVSEEKGWTDFTVLESGTAEVTVSPGRVYNSGAVYVSETNVVFDLLGQLPAVNKKWVAIVGWGQAVEVDTQPRDFLIDATTGATEPQAVPMQELLKANINTVIGVEAAQPAQPSVDSANVIIAWVLLNPTGVESIEMVLENRLPQVRRNSLSISELEAWRALIGPRVDALASDLARIFSLLAQVGSDRLLHNIAFDVARLKELSELEDDYTDYGADRFLDTGESDVENVNFLAKVEEGVRFSDDAADLEALELFNPLNSDVIISNGFLLPKYTEVKRFSVGPFHEGHSISQYQFQEHSMVQRTMSRRRIRYGETLTVCTNDRWWKSGRYDVAQGIFFKDGDTWEVLNGVPDTAGGDVHWVRVRRYWVDTYTVHYWDRIVIPHTVQGQQIAQTFLNAQDGWLTSIGLYFTEKGGTGNVDVALAEVFRGAPDLENILNKVTLDVEDIETSGNGTRETKVPFPATFLEAGKRYAIILTTGGNHHVGMALGTQYAQGTFFFSLDGAYQMGTADKDLMFSLYFANFSRTRTVVDLDAMSLSGGIAYIDIMAPMIVPASCDLTFEVQVGGVWTPLTEVTSGNTILFGLPPLLPFRAVFTGTTDVQPGIDMQNSVLSFSRPRTTFKHISTEYTLAATIQDFKVVAILENFFEDNHDLDCKILIDGEGEEISAASVVDEELSPPVDARSENHKRIRRTFTWTSVEIAGGMDSVVIVLNGSTSSALDTFHVAERVHLAFGGA